MDPITIGLLTAIAGGAGGEAGKQVWATLSRLVRRSPGKAQGEQELVALEQSPRDVARAGALREVLVSRAAEDPEFAAGLQTWLDQARGLHLEKSETTNTISGTVHGGAVQGRDFGSITFGSGGGSA